MLVSLIFALEARPLAQVVLQVPSHLEAEAVTSLRLVALAAISRALIGILNSSQVIRLRMDLYTSINTVGVIAQLCLVPVTLALGGGVVAASAVLAALTVALAVAHSIASLRLVPRLIQPRVQWSLVGPLVRFGSTVLVATIAGVILSSAEKLLLSHFWAPTALAHYWVAFSMSRLIAAAPEAMGYSLLPAFAQLQGASAREPLSRLYARALRGTLLVLGPTVTVMWLWARPLLTLWAGREYGEASTMPFCILVGGVACHVMALIPSNLLIARGSANLIARYQLAELLPYVALAAGLTAWLGGVGAALASSAIMILNCLFLFRASRRVAGMSFIHCPRAGVTIVSRSCSWGSPYWRQSSGIRLCCWRGRPW